MIKTAIIGLGYWGPNYIRVIGELEHVTLKYCCDISEEKLKKVKAGKYTKKITDYKEILNDEEVTAVVVTTSPNSHYNIVKECLKAGKDIMVEKPLTLDSKSSKELVDIAQKENRILMVGHTYVYNPGIQKIKEMMADNNFSQAFYGFSSRLGLSPIRKSASALWDLATHDISIAQYLFGKPEAVACTGESYIQQGIEDYVSVTLKYSDDFHFLTTASWFCPEKIRKMTLVGKEKMIVFDDVNKEEMVKIFNRSLDLPSLDTSPSYSDHQQIVREGDIYIPNIIKSEPLKNLMKHFLGCVKTRKKPRSDGNQGVNVIKTLELAEKSMKNDGKFMEWRE